MYTSVYGLYSVHVFIHCSCILLELDIHVRSTCVSHFYPYLQYNASVYQCIRIVYRPVLQLSKAESSFTAVYFHCYWPALRFWPPVHFLTCIWVYKICIQLVYSFLNTCKYFLQPLLWFFPLHNQQFDWLKDRRDSSLYSSHLGCNEKNPLRTRRGSYNKTTKKKFRSRFKHRWARNNLTHTRTKKHEIKMQLTLTNNSCDKQIKTSSLDD